jgi:hypothetical protein
LDDQLKQKVRNYYPVWFNPWRYSENEALWAAFAVEFEKQLANKAPWKAKAILLWQSLERKKLLYDLISMLVPVIGLVLVFAWQKLISDSPVLQALQQLLTFAILLLGLYP